MIKKFLICTSMALTMIACQEDPTEGVTLPTYPDEEETTAEATSDTDAGDGHMDYQDIIVRKN